MTHTYGYRWATLFQGTIWLPIVVAIFYWQGKNFTLAANIAFAIAFLFMASRNAVALCSIQINDHEIKIHFLLPIRSGGIFKHKEIESYSEVSANLKGEAVPIAGFLAISNRKRLMLVKAGTKNFVELNAVLKEIYPKVETNITQP